MMNSSEEIMEQQNKTKLTWLSILTVALGTIASLLLYFAGWVASVTSFITMFVLIFLYKKYCGELPKRKTLIYEIIAVCTSHVLAILLSMFIMAAIYNNVSIGEAIAMISSNIVSYIVLFVITMVLTIAMSLFGTLSAYQYYKNVFKIDKLSSDNISKQQQQTITKQVDEQAENKNESEPEQQETEKSE